MSPSIILLTLLGAVPAQAEAPALPSIRAVRTEHAPVIDGRLDELVWEQAPPSNAFTQKWPDEGKAPSEETRVHVLYDDDAIYIAVACTQARTPIRQRLTRRDREAESQTKSAPGRPGNNRSVGGSVADRVTVHIGSRRDGATAFQFGINAAGVLSDGVHFDDTLFTARWDENWEGQSAVTDDGWSAEMRIPMRVLRFDDEPVQNWGFNVRRYIAGRQEVDEWAFTPRTDPGVVSRFGELRELADLRPSAALELSPFVVLQTAHDNLPGPREEAWTRRVSGGLDGKWHPTQALTLSATLNPDFGQVEADQVVLNLTTYEIYLPEKRPFFLEGAELFETPKMLLHTRRIGEAPGSPALLTGEQVVTPPRLTSILGALKLTGQPVRGLSLGLLSALTDRNEVTVFNEGGGDLQQIRRLAAPRMVANALRLKVDTGTRSAIGLMATAANRIEEDDRYPTKTVAGTGAPATLCPSGATITGGDCHHDSYVAGVDTRWRSAGGNHYVSTQLAGSQVKGGTPRTMADGSVIAPGDSDVIAVADFGKDGGHWLWRGYFNYTGKEFDYNSLGFQQAQNVAYIDLQGGYRSTSLWRGLRDTKTTLGFGERASASWQRLRRELELENTVTLDNMWRLGTQVTWVMRNLDQREIRGASAIFERSRYWRYGATVTTPSNQPVIAQASFEVRDRSLGFATETEFALMLRTFSRVELDLLGSIETSTGEPRYLSRSTDLTGVTDYRFAELDATGVSTTLRATLAMSPTLTLQAYSQLFLAYRRHHAFSSFQGPEARVTVYQGDLQPTVAPQTMPDSANAALNATVVLRWEYSLGSTLFLVYSRSQTPDGTLMPGMRAGLDFMSLPRAPAVDALMLKLSYWWA